MGEDGTGDDGDADSPEITMQRLAKMMTSMNENMAAVASSRQTPQRAFGLGL
jgi:hypothetical protein